MVFIKVSKLGHQRAPILAVLFSLTDLNDFNRLHGKIALGFRH
jgi:hypothetical protein